MLALTRLPSNVRYVLQGTQQFFHFRHHLIFSWVLVLLLVYQDKATLQGLVRLGPKHVCECICVVFCARRIGAGGWCWGGWLKRCGRVAAGRDGRVLLVVDGTYKAKTGAQTSPWSKRDDSIA